jgi:Holliday junction resolvasome RuvABC endonuclease subunit
VRRAVVNILALDLGTRTGWALSENGRIESGVQVCDVKRGESPGMRYVRFNRWLDEITWDRTRSHDQRRVGLVVYEAAHHRGGAATEILSGMATRVLEMCARYPMEHASVHSATLKKFVTGRGNADKTQVARYAVLKQWATDGMDDNEVDALCLLRYALIELTVTARPER